MSNDERPKVQLAYPCSWVYKIIGPDEDEMRQAAAEIIGDCKHLISLSRSSKTGKYHSLNVELTVESEDHRISLYAALKAHRAIKIIL
jgi:uncharacterized protein